MKIEKTKPKKSISEVPLVTKELISRLLLCSDDELIEMLKSTVAWRFGKCELYHWVDLLDRFDLILDEAARPSEAGQRSTDNEEGTACVFLCPKLEEPKFKDKVVTVLNFTALLIEHSYARHIYNSTEHLCVLLACPDLDVVLAVLNLLYVFSKRSNFISRLAPKKRSHLNSYLEYLAESWGGKQNGFGLAQCCTNGKKSAFPESCTTVYFQYQPEEKPHETQVVPTTHQGAVTESISLQNVDQLQETIPELMSQLTTERHIPHVHQMQLLTRLRLARNFPSTVQRRKCVMSRLQAISILVYSVGPPEIVDPLIYDGFVEELVEVLEIKGTDIMEIKAAVLRTLTAIIHLERDPRLAAIIEATGAATYHGFLPSLVRDCVAVFTTSKPSALEESDFPLTFATALFSFLYHLATYEASGDALVTSGIMESLLLVLEWKAYEPMNITLVTRAVRVIDLITGLDMSAFHSHGGWNKMLDRLQQEVAYCARDVPGILPPELKPSRKPAASGSEGGAGLPDADDGLVLLRYEDVAMDTSEDLDSTLKGEEQEEGVVSKDTGRGLEGSGILMCMPERAALIKSILNFLKKAIPEPTFAENIRTFVDSSLPHSLMHIVSNAEYYGPSIYLPATEVTTVFIFHEPSQLSALQENGLPGVVLNSVICKQIPVTREVLSSLPNILSAMCLNARGLQEFIAAGPFDHLFSVLISPNYLPAMRKKKGADPVGDTASNLGVAMDELMRHQPTLRVNIIAALIRLLERLIVMGSVVPTQSSVDQDHTHLPHPSGATSAGEGEVSATPSQENAEVSNEGVEEETDSEDDDSTEGDGEDGKVLSSERPAEAKRGGEGGGDKTLPPLTEYIINVVHFLDAILSNNSTDDHMREFIGQQGLEPLLRLLSLPVLPLDFPTSAACTAITGACRSIMHISHSPELLVTSLTQLSSLLTDLSPFLKSPQNASNSILLQEIGPLSNMTEAIKSPTVTPVLHKLVAVNSFIQLFVNLSRSCQAGYNTESRLLCVTHWASAIGQTCLHQLSALYRALVWEGFILLAVAAGEDSTGQGAGSHMSADPVHMELDRPAQPEMPSVVVEPPADQASADTAHVRPLTDTPQHPSILVESLKQLTPLLTITSRVGRSLAELMSLLVRLSTSPLHRTHRRGVGHPLIVHSYQEPAKEAIEVCMEVTNLLVDSLKWEVPMPEACSSAMQSPIRDWLFAGMTFKMYAVDFCELLLYDEQKQAYHMMQHAFHNKGALEAFINTFHMALKIVAGPGDSKSVYGSCVDFLEAWLNLAEKLVNASAILDSSHALPIPPTSQANGKKLMFSPIFNPLAFVIQTQKAVFPCLVELWESPQLAQLNPKVVELLIATIKHLYSNEKLIQTKLAEFFKSTGVASSSASKTVSKHPPQSGSSEAPPSSVPPPPPVHPSVDPLFLQQLCDMGFSRAHGEEALIACANDLASAMDWILNHPPSSSANAVAVGEELSEEEQIMRAIALSLGEDVSAKSKELEDKKKKEEEEKARQLADLKEREHREMEPLEKQVLDDFSSKLLPGCLQLVSSISESVYRVCDLISSLARRNGEEWRNQALSTVHDKVLASVRHLVLQLEQSTEPCGVWKEEGDPVACQMLLLGLLMEEMPITCAQAVCRDQLLSACISLLQLTEAQVLAVSASSQGVGNQAEATPTPKWLSPLLLVLNEWEKALAMCTWTRPPKKDCSVVWQWFDNTRWCSYTSDMCQLIEKAYQDKENSVNIRGGRHRSDNSRNVLHFAPMLQCNSENNVNRPVMRLEIPKSEQSVEDPLNNIPAFHHLNGDNATLAIKSCTHLLTCPLDPDTLHANLRLCLRLTRNAEQATVFAQEGGPQALLFLTQKSGFRGFASLITLLFKHCLEDGVVLKHAMETVIRTAVTSPFFNSKEVRPQAMGGRELYYVMRKLGPCASRNPKLFMELVCGIIRLCSEPPAPAVYSSTQRTPTTLVKCVPPSKLEHMPMNSVQNDLVNLLIDRLCAEDTWQEGSKPSAMEEKSAEPKIEEEGEVQRAMHFEDSRRGRVRRGSYRRQLTTGTYDDDDVNSEDMAVDAEENNNSRLSSSLGVATTSSSPTEERDGTTTAGKPEASHDQPLMSKAAILRLLSELVETYPACAKLISESSRKVKLYGKPAKEMTVLAFLFDHLLPASSNTSGKVPAIAKLSKTFIQCLAVSHPSPEIVSVLVTEFKHALARALSLPESTSKHNRIRALTGLLSQISDYITAARGALNPSHFARLLIRKGFISDLARAVHCLNLSSPMLAGTINSILKPLEVLTKIVNQVAAASKKADAEKGPPAAAAPPTSGGREQVETQAVSEYPGPHQVTITVDIAPPTGPEGTPGSEDGNMSTGAVTETSQTGGTEFTSLEATHESLIPLEEEEEEEEQAAASAMELEQRANLLDQVVHLARDLGRSHRLRGEMPEGLVEEILETTEDMDTEIAELLEGAHAGGVDTSMSDESFRGSHHSHDEEREGESEDEDMDSDDDDDEITDDEEEILDEDGYNSAGEEVEDEFDESHMDETVDLDDTGSDGPGYSDTDSSSADESTTEIEEEEEEGEGEGREEGEEPLTQADAPPETADNVNSPSGGVVSGVEGGAGRVREAGFEADEEEEEDEVDEEEVDEDELDLEYSYDDEDEEDMADYLHVDVPWGLREPDLDVHFHGGLPSFFARAYHSRPSQTAGTDLEQHSATARTLPEHHPLLVRHADHPQQVTSRAVGGPSVHVDSAPANQSSSGNANQVGVSGGVEPPHHESAMQQLLSNISVAAGTNEVLGFGVTPGNTHRNRGPSGSQPPSQDNGLESTHIPKVYSRWQEESIALDGNAPHLCMAVLRDNLIQQLVEIYKKENAPSSPKPKSTQAASGTTPTTTTTTNSNNTATSALPSVPTVQAGERSVPMAPHPSDQVTPSSHSPRETGSSVDQLRSSLRQVADALAQTVAAVRTTREQLLGGGREEEGVERTEEEEQLMESFASPQVPLHPGGHLTPISDTSLHNSVTLSTTVDRPLLMAASMPSQATPPLASSSLPPPLPTFDGSQESAAATLASTDPNDPMHTFLSAIVGAPAPPLPGSPNVTPPIPGSDTAVSSTASTTVMTTPTITSTSPRLPVFTRLQQSDSNTIQPHSGTTEPSNQDNRETATSAAVTPGSVPSMFTSHLASQVNQFLSSQPPPQSQGQEVRTSTLAEELARVVSQLVPPPSSSPPSSSPSSSSSYSTSLGAPPTTTVRTTGGAELATGQSPSPSDMLAPMLMASLQMPSSTASPQGGQSSVVAVSTASLQQAPPQGATPNRPSPASPVAVAMDTVPPSPGVAVSGTSGQTIVPPPQFTPPTTAVSTAQATPPGATPQATPNLSHIDPAFLAALPDSIRQEVMAQHEREQRLLRAQREASFMSAISPEFLAALPPNIQEEVLQQEHLERARQNPTSATVRENVDNATFFHNLPSDLRRAILSDMDDSLITHLPDEMRTEAQTLRQERDSRRRQMLEQRHAFLERMMEEAHLRSNQSGGDAAAILPPTSWPQLTSQGMRYAVVNLNPHMLDGHVLGNMQTGATSYLTRGGTLGPHHARAADQHSKQMLDQEALTCLLVLLFLDQSKLHNNRLHRIIKNLSQHSPTRAWILSSLLAIIKEMRKTPSVVATPITPSVMSTPISSCPMPPPLTHSQSEGVAPLSTPVIMSPHCGMPHWLDISINAALGSHAKMFQLESEVAGKNPISGSKINIHPLAGTTVSHNVLDVLIFLGRHFGQSFLPSDLLLKDKMDERREDTSDVLSNFWQILLKLDGAVGRKGKGAMKGFKYSDTKCLLTEQELFSASIIGQLMSLFTHDIIKENISLTDKLLRLLSVASSSIPRSGLKGLSKEAPPTTASPGNWEGGGSNDMSESKTAVELEDVFEKKEPTLQLSIVAAPLLGNVIHVLTSGLCSEEGLEEATTLLTNLSKCSIPTREQILYMLLDGVRTIGHTLCSQIIALDDSVNARIQEQVLEKELLQYQQDGGEGKKRAGPGGPLAGVVLPSTVMEDQHTDHSHDLHIPTMAPLTCKGSQQSFFVRMLKVVCQLRESAQLAINAANKTSTAVASQQLTSEPLPSAEATQATTSSDTPSASQQNSESVELLSAVEQKSVFLQMLSRQLELEELWCILSNCLDALSHTEDPHAVFVLQPTVEAFFLVHANYKDDGQKSKKKPSHLLGSRFSRLSSSHLLDSESNPASPSPFSPLPATPGPGESGDVDPFAHLPPDTTKFLKFAEKHRTVLNQILRQSTIPLADGPFAVLVNYTKHLDFDIKRRHFRHELERMDEGLRREDIVLHLRRDHVFEDSFREFRRPAEELKGNLYIQFEGEEGQDVGGLLREWYMIIAREMFNPNYALFQLTPGDRVTYIPNPSSQINPNHLDYFKFIGKVIAKAIYDNKLLDCYFTRSFYKHILGKQLHYTDMEAEDYAFYQGMVYLLEHDLNEIGMELFFSIEMEEFGKTVVKELKPDGQNIAVATESNKREYVQRACNMKMRESIKMQIDSFLKGFYEIIPKQLISIFNEQELELLISGLPTIDIDDLKANTEYHKYTESSLQIVWFWRALRSFEQADRANFLQFVTGTSKVPLTGFAALEGMNGVQKFQIHRDDRSTDRLPSAHTCFNQLDLPPYETYDKLRQMLLTACTECPEGFGFA